MKIDRMRILSQRMLTASLAASFVDSPVSEEEFLRSSVDRLQPGATLFLDLLATPEDELRAFLRALYRDAMALVPAAAGAVQTKG